MCTAVSFGGNFGRNLDLEGTYGEKITLVPRSFPLRFRCVAPLASHYAMLGMAHVEEGWPLYYDAMNEKGLAMAGLNFPDYAVYAPYHAGVDNVAPFELIAWVLARCADVEQAKALLRGVNLLQQDFSPELPLTPLHWMAADRTGAAIVVEPVEEGLRIVDAPAGVLTNAPPFDWQMTDLSRYMALSSAQPENRFAPGLELPVFSRGMGAMGLPGDLSSTSRFVRAAFFRHNSPTPGTPEEGVSQMFHILNTVAQPRGGVVLPGGGEVRTVYAACCDLGRGIYFWRSYENSRLTAAALEEMDLEGKALVTWPLSREQDVLWKRAE